MDWQHRLKLAGFPEGVEQAFHNWANGYDEEFNVPAFVEEVEGIVDQEFDSWIAKYDYPEEVLQYVDTLISDDRFAEIAEKHEREVLPGLSEEEARTLAYDLADRKLSATADRSDVSEIARDLGIITRKQTITEEVATMILDWAGDIEMQRWREEND